jgi:hypothetical protein
LVEHKVLLPGATTLARLVAAVRTDASERLWDQIADGVDGDLGGRLNALLEVEAGSRFSMLERLRTSPTKLTGSELERALMRVATWAFLRRALVWRGKQRPDMADGCPDILEWKMIWSVFRQQRGHRERTLGRVWSMTPSKPGWVSANSTTPF